MCLPPKFKICYTSLYIQSISPWSSPLPSVGDHHPQWVNLPPHQPTSHRNSRRPLWLWKPHCFPLNKGRLLNQLSLRRVPRWWFQIFFIFTPTWGNDPIWRAYFFKWAGSTTTYRYLRGSVDQPWKGRLQRLQHGAGANFDLQRPISGRSSSRLRAGKSPNSRRCSPTRGGYSFQVTRRINRKHIWETKMDPKNVWWNRMKPVEDTWTNIERYGITS